jgi:ubiquinone biosynthesis UbiH/UbiF/VisC/COQ6 family hydroxylase
MNVDVLIVGAGPVGLSLARSLSGQGLSILLIDQQKVETLANPPSDGREIALTHSSLATLKQLGIWEHFADGEISSLRDAQVLNGPSAYSLRIQAAAVGEERLGCLISNQAIRRAVFAAASDCVDVQLLAHTRLVELNCHAQGVQAQLSNGQQVHARLVVAADSRFSDTRRRLGIGARMEDFGKSMLVCRMKHEVAHEQIAWEWFGYGQTLALLPLNGRCSSAVLTLPPAQISQMRCLDTQTFARQMEQRFDHRLGRMELIGERYVYPLIGVYAERFAGLRCALVGDTAVGMHPVTAHGFNFGLQSQKRLAHALLEGVRQGLDIGDPGALQRYARAHQRASWPLYQATSLLVRLYTDDRAPTRLLRNTGLRLAQNLSPLKWLLARQLTQVPNLYR